MDWIVLSVVSVVGVLMTVAVAGICPVDWQRYGESCYMVLNQPKMTWSSAVAKCASHQAVLVVPNSAGEQSFIWELYKAEYDGMPPGNLWVGCKDTSGEGVWDPCPYGDRKGYRNWLPDQPDNDTSTACVIMKQDADGKWGDQRCLGKKFVACERPTDAGCSTGVFCLQTGSIGRVVSRCLLNHVLEEIPGLGFLSCQSACRSAPRCRSFNLLGKGRGNMSCQLNDVPSYTAADGDIKHDGYCYLSDL